MDSRYTHHRIDTRAEKPVLRGPVLPLALSLFWVILRTLDFLFQIRHPALIIVHALQKILYQYEFPTWYIYFSLKNQDAVPISPRPSRFCFKHVYINPLQTHCMQYKPKTHYDVDEAHNGDKAPYNQLQIILKYRI